ncbi:MAG: Mur ligase family protein, partial [Patescibacteria group bacterium]
VGLMTVDKTPSRSPLTRGRKVVVLELSSWMLESAGDAKISPQFALITNIMPDHLNTYAGMPEYIAAKENIFRYQRADDLAVYNYDNEITRKMGERARAKRFWFGKKIKGEGVFIKNGTIIFRQCRSVETHCHASLPVRQKADEQKICSIGDIRLVGEHNLYNVMAAAAFAAAMGVPPGAIRKAIKNFRGLPNRLEFIR